MNEQQRKSLGVKLLFARRLKNITQEEIAARIGVRQSHYQKIETGKIGVDFIQLHTLCHVLELSFKECLELCIGVHARGKVDWPEDSVTEEQKKINAVTRVVEDELLKKDELIKQLKKAKKNLDYNDLW